MPLYADKLGLIFLYKTFLKMHRIQNNQLFYDLALDNAKTHCSVTIMW